jgi:hypothetical protein
VRRYTVKKEGTFFQANKRTAHRRLVGWLVKKKRTTGYTNDHCSQWHACTLQSRATDVQYPQSKWMPRTCDTTDRSSCDGDGRWAHHPGFALHGARAHLVGDLDSTSTVRLWQRSHTLSLPKPQQRHQEPGQRLTFDFGRMWVMAC